MKGMSELSSHKICIRKKTVFLGAFLIVIFFVVIFFSNRLLSTPTSYKSKAAAPKSPSAIVGGGQVDPAEWPFIVKIFTSSKAGTGFEQCTGTLIAPNWVLAAGHCVTDLITTSHSVYKPDDVEVYMSFWQDNPILPVEKVIRHLGYKELDPTNCGKDQNGGIDYCKRIYTNINDIALIKLKAPAQSNLYTPRTISLNGDTTIEKEIVNQTNQRVLMMGLGVTDPNATGTRSYLYSAIAPLLSNVRANKPNWLDSRLIDADIVAGYPKGGASICYGDSGGPYLIWNGTQWVQVGIASWMIPPCGSARKPGVDVRVSSYLSWIQENTKETVFDSASHSYRMTFVGANKGTFIGKDVSSYDLTTFNCRINGITPPGAPSNICGHELQDDDMTP